MKILDLNQMKYIREGSRTRNKIVTLSEKKMKKEDYISCLQNKCLKVKSGLLWKQESFLFLVVSKKLSRKFSKDNQQWWQWWYKYWSAHAHLKSDWEVRLTMIYWRWWTWWLKWSQSLSILSSSNQKFSYKVFVLQRHNKIVWTIFS